MTHRDGLPRFSALSARCGDAGHSKAWATTSESLGSAALRVAYAARRRASKRLDDAPHRRRPFSYPTDRIRDLYESLSVTFGIISKERFGDLSPLPPCYGLLTKITIRIIPESPDQRCGGGRLPGGNQHHVTDARQDVGCFPKHGNGDASPSRSRTTGRRG